MLSMAGQQEILLSLPTPLGEFQHTQQLELTLLVFLLLLLLLLLLP